MSSKSLRRAIAEALKTNGRSFRVDLPIYSSAWSHDEINTEIDLMIGDGLVHADFDNGVETIRLTTLGNAYLDPWYKKICSYMAANWINIVLIIIGIVSIVIGIVKMS